MKRSSRKKKSRAHQGDERLRRDHQLHEQLLKLNWNVREAHEKSLSEMEELKRFQSSTFDTIARRKKLVEDRDTIHELTSKIQELKNEVNCLNDSRGFFFFKKKKPNRCHSTLPVNQCFSHLIQFLEEC